MGEVADLLKADEQSPVGASTKLIDEGELEIETDSTDDVFARTSFEEKDDSLGEEGDISMITTIDTVRLIKSFEVKELPAVVTDLDASQTDENGNKRIAEFAEEFHNFNKLSY